MIEIDASAHGSHLSALLRTCNQRAVNGVQRACDMIRDDAKQRCPVDTGDLRQSIVSAVTKVGDKIIGTVGSSKEHAIYVEFGTGPKGQESHEGISPDVTPAYRQSQWFIPIDLIDASTAERYHMFQVGGYYVSRGQPAKPYLYPASHDNHSKALKIIEEAMLHD